MCNIIIEFGISMNLVRLINMCLNKSCDKLLMRKDLSDVFPIQSGLKQGDALLPFVLNFI